MDSLTSTDIFGAVVMVAVIIGFVFLIREMRRKRPDDEDER